MGIIEKLTLDDVTMNALEARARQSGVTISEEAADLLRAGLHAAEARQALVERSRALRAAIPRQTTDSLSLLREDRDR